LFEDFRADIGRLRHYGNTQSTIRLFFFNQGLWACGCYRAGRYLNDLNLPGVIRQLVMFPYHIWWKWVEITTGISISPDCRIGPGLYIGHFGQIILHSDVVMGKDCNLSQGVTIGLAQRDGKWGVPTLGDGVYLAPGSKVIGPIHLADGTVVGANAVVIQDTEENSVVGGVPARVLRRQGQGEDEPSL